MRLVTPQIGIFLSPSYHAGNVVRIRIRFKNTMLAHNNANYAPLGQYQIPQEPAVSVTWGFMV